MATTTYTKTDTWGTYEREGYSQTQKVAVYVATKPVVHEQGTDWARVEEWIACMGAFGALAWSARIVSRTYPLLDALWETPGPLEACAIAALVWLHAKWRRSVRVR